MTRDTAADCRIPHHTDPQHWRATAIAATLALIARLIWDVERGVAVIEPEHPWEPVIVFYDLDDLREHLLCLVHDAWAAVVEWSHDGPVEAPLADAIVNEALSSCHDRLVAMGWRAPMEAPSR